MGHRPTLSPPLHPHHWLAHVTPPSPASARPPPASAHPLLARERRAPILRSLPTSISPVHVVAHPLHVSRSRMDVLPQSPQLSVPLSRPCTSSGHRSHRPLAREHRTPLPTSPCLHLSRSRVDILPRSPQLSVPAPVIARCPRPLPASVVVHRPCPSSPIARARRRLYPSLAHARRPPSPRLSVACSPVPVTSPSRGLGPLPAHRCKCCKGLSPSPAAFCILMSRAGYASRRPLARPVLATPSP
ncbi:hypothetical protein BD310DRAFT_771023, partial [Dichomitus squalens]